MASIVAGILPEYFQTFFENVDEHPYLFASLGSMLVGLSGILPMLIIPIDNTASFENGAGAATLRILLSFAVGGMLGDVFLHLLPEAWYHDLANVKEGEPIPMKCGLWCLLGMLMFIIVEKLFAAAEHGEEEEAPEKKHNGSVKQLEIEEIDKLLEKERQHRIKLGGKVEGNGALPGCNGDATAKQIYESCLFNNNVLGDGACCNEIASQNGATSCNKGSRWMGRCLLREAKEKALQANNDKKDNTASKHIAGYLNLMANSIDNFTHGLAVGGSFLVGARVGALTTFAILVHEIPHEVGDFAILLKSGFTRWEAAKAQLATASAGLIGAMTAVIFSGAKNSIEARTSWVAPFTAGGFLHIALVTVLPDLLRQPGRAAAAAHLTALLAGLALMALLNLHF